MYPAYASSKLCEFIGIITSVHNYDEGDKQTGLRPGPVAEKSGYSPRQADQCEEASQLPVKEMCFIKLKG